MYKQKYTKEFKKMITKYKNAFNQLYKQTQFDFEQEFTIKKIKLPMTLNKMSKMFGDVDTKKYAVVLLHEHEDKGYSDKKYKYLYCTRIKDSFTDFDNLNMWSPCHNYYTKADFTQSLRQEGTAYILIGNKVKVQKKYNDIYLKDIEKNIERAKGVDDNCYRARVKDLQGNKVEFNCYNATFDKSGYYKGNQLKWRLQTYKENKATNNIKNNVYNKDIAELKTQLLQQFNKEKEKVNNIYDFQQISKMKDSCKVFVKLNEMSNKIIEFENTLLEQINNENKHNKMDDEYIKGRLKNLRELLNNSIKEYKYFVY